MSAKKANQKQAETSSKAAKIKQFEYSIRRHLRSQIAHDRHSASRRDWWIVTCLATREIVLENYTSFREKIYAHNKRRIYYFSLEYLMGKHLRTTLVNLELYDVADKALQNLNMDLEAICETGPDLGLGNGGLGRLAACFLDSITTLSLPSMAYGIHYEFGLFRQDFVNGRQVEHPDEWVRFGNPWEIIRPECAVKVQLYGHVQRRFDNFGVGKIEWLGARKILGVPYDIPVAGFRTKSATVLRLWEARSDSEFDFNIFNKGGYSEAVREKVESETISKVLYPNDETESGKELRLVQQYFFVACSLRDIISRHFAKNDSWSNFSEKAVIQLNDTHPAIAIVELMRILVDEEEMMWDEAWQICCSTFAYTNHTLMPEALERWSVNLFEKILPRHLQLIYEINKRFLENVVMKKWPNDMEKVRNLSIIEEGNPKKVRMAALSVVGSFSVNGVAALHTKLLKKYLFSDFYKLFPKKFNNKTNGIAPRRWLLACNYKLSEFITEKIGDQWPADLSKLESLMRYADDEEVLRKILAIKHENKEILAAHIKKTMDLQVDPDAIFDVQIKRLHEYKRQHMKLLHILSLYSRLLQGKDNGREKRVFIFGAKAAPGYKLAKEIIHAINAVAKKINNDKRINDRLKVVFLPNYTVTLAELIIPAADLSEQISTAGREASGTGNMKLALNGAITIGTLDGANVEIREEVGDDNIIIFGNTVSGIENLVQNGYNPYDFYNKDEELRDSIDWLSSGYFTGNSNDFAALCHSFLDGGDPYFVLADFRQYVEAQRKAEKFYADKMTWARMSLVNTAKIGKFSSDRTISEYASEIWKVKSFKI